MQHNVAFANSIDVIRVRFVARVNDWLQDFILIREDLTAGMAARNELLALRNKSHKIAGSAATFGFPDFGLAGLILEAEIDRCLDCGDLGAGREKLLASLNTFIQHADELRNMRPPERTELSGKAAQAATVPESVFVPFVSTAPQKAKTSRIMIVDDDDLIRWCLREALDAEGRTFVEAVNGREALEKLFSHGDCTPGQEVDVIILDIDMPELGGFETLDAINASPLRETLPVIMLTARTDDISHIRGYSKGVLEYLTKPIDLEFVPQIVNDVLVRSAGKRLQAG